MRRILLLCLLSALLGGLAAFGWRSPLLNSAPSSAQDAPAGGAAAPVSPPPAQAAPTPPAAAGFESLTPDEQVNVFVYQQANRSVVNINTKGLTGVSDVRVGRRGRGERHGHRPAGARVDELPRGRLRREIHVTLFDGKTYEARLVGGDPDTDVAVLWIDAPPESLFPVTVTAGASTNLLVGQRVFAIGNPFGFERTLSTGIISSLNRSLPSKTGRRSLKSIIQIDAAINPGNSGGPLLDSHARLIGMNTAIASTTGATPAWDSPSR